MFSQVSDVAHIGLLFPGIYTFFEPRNLTKIEYTFKIVC